MHIEDFSGKRVHFVGIGGVSMSSLAKLLHGWGYQVTGSDQNDSPVLDALRALGIPCAVGHSAANIQGSDLAVYTAAVDTSNPELAWAQAHGVPLMSRGTLLGQLMQRYPVSMGVAGTHGKTTTSSMLATILELTGRNPTIHLGGVLPLIGSAGKMGGKDVFVAEACEYKDSFLMLHPTDSILLNIDADHLDYFRDLDHIQTSFAAYCALHPAHGYILGNGEDPRVRQVLAGAPCATETFGLTPDCDWQAASLTCQQGCYAYDALHHGEKAAHVVLEVPGRHNVANSLAALAMAVHYGVDPQEAADSLRRYGGAKRRMEKIGERDGVLLYHDYAHHPTEVRATLDAMAGLTQGALICVFQPHTYSRTKLLFDDWTRAFDAAAHLLILDIYAAREANPGTISSAMLAEAIAAKHPDCRYAPSFQDAAAMALERAHPGDLILTLGAGDVEKVHDFILRG